MGNLNYFFPYDKGTENHEDHLTRAFLVLLKYSSSAFQHFYSYVHYKLLEQGIDELKPIHMIQLQEKDFGSQKGSLPVANTYLSVLITNESINIEQDIIPVERNAIYDGIICLEEELVIFFETKPNKNNVWTGQLCPSQKDIPDEATLINRLVVLEWKEIINFLHRISENNSTLPHEKLLITDFFDLINRNFDYLNPYNDFSKCHSVHLAGKRIEQVLCEIASNIDKVKYHSGWGYYIELDFEEIRKIAIILNDKNDDDWDGITISADFGSTVSQARSFYSNIQSFEVIENLVDWDKYDNFHLAFKNQNLVFLGTGGENIKEYFEYYNDKGMIWDNIRQIPKTELDEWLIDLENKGLVNYGELNRQTIEDKIMNKGYTTVNLCPSLYLEYFISKEDAMKLDKEGKLVPLINMKMKEVLGILNQSLENVLN